MNYFVEEVIMQMMIFNCNRNGTPRSFYEKY